MKSTLLTMPWYHWLIVIFALTIAICFIVWFIAKVVRGRFKLGPVEIGGTNVLTNGKSPHSTCEYRFNLGVIIRKLIDWTVKEHDIRTRGILGAQMVKTDEYILTVKDKSASWFISVLRVKLKERGDSTLPIHHADYLHYRLVMQEFVVRIKDIIRAACINNGFPTMTESRYGEYVKDVNKRIGGYASRFFEENYIGNVIQSDDLKSKEAVNFYMELADLVSNLFEVLRRVAVGKQVELADMLMKKQAFIEGKLGIKEF